MRWTRRPRLPDDARARLPLEPGERVLAAGRRSDGVWVVATDRALVQPGARLDWADVAHAEWDADGAALSVAEIAQSGRPPAHHRFAFDEPGFLPETVRERVMASIVATRHVAVSGRRGVRVVARRAAGSDEVQWQILVDSGVDADDPMVLAAADQALESMRQEIETGSGRAGAPGAGLGDVSPPG